MSARSGHSDALKLQFESFRMRCQKSTLSWSVIKSAASAASRETKNQGPRSRGAPEPRRPQAEPSSVGSPGSWSLIFGLPGGCASSQLDHGLKVQLFPKHAQNMRKTCAKPFQNEQNFPNPSQTLAKPFPKLFPIAANPFSRYLAPLGAKYLEKRSKKNSKKSMDFCLFWPFYIGNPM